MSANNGDDNHGHPRFAHYPRARQGPLVPYKNETQSIPVFRGTPLAVGAALIQNIGFLQSYLWRDAKFSVVREVPHLDQYAARYDPTVIPLEPAGQLGYTSASNNANANSGSTSSSNTNKTGRYYTAADYRAHYLAGDLTPTAVIETLLDAIRRDSAPAAAAGKHAVAFLETREDLVRAAAQASTQRYKDGASLGPLDGVPVAVKDEVHVQGYKRTLGTNGLDFKAGCDGTSWCVRMWQRAGAIVIGKTSMHELGLDTNNNNPTHGTPRNPHNSNFYCGGSSGGSGYAVGAGLVPIALGADGGGSIRIPASFCGVWGLKPSHGRVSGAPTVDLAVSVDVYGPMAASIDDLELAYRVMATPAPADEDPVSAQFPPPLTQQQQQQPSGARPDAPPKVIGIVRDWVERAEPAVRAIFDAAIEYYQTQQSYRVVDIAIPYLPEGQRAHTLTILAEIASGVPPDQIRRLAAPNKVLVSLGMYQIHAQDLIAAQRLRNLLMSHLAYLFKTHPGLIIATPTSPLPGWKIDRQVDLVHGLSDGKTSIRNMEFAWLANFVGCPAITCPAGYVPDETRVPVGIMGMGEWGSEQQLFGFARDGAPRLQPGLRVPDGPLSSWMDVIAEASGKTAGSAGVCT